jgi:hypothetical protein
VEDRVEWELLPGTGTWRWRLEDLSDPREHLHLEFEWTASPEEKDFYAFVLTDSIRWTGEIRPLGTAGDISSHRWDSRLAAWVLWDEFTWEAGRGHWVHHGRETTPMVHSWGASLDSVRI